MIDGVKIIDLKTFGDDRGFFREIFRFDEQFNGVDVGQLSHSMVREGVIKGWHGHVYQSQWNYILVGEARSLSKMTESIQLATEIFKLLILEIVILWDIFFHQEFFMVIAADWVHYI